MTSARDGGDVDAQAAHPLQSLVALATVGAVVFVAAGAMVAVVVGCSAGVVVAGDYEGCTCDYHSQ